MKKILVTTDFSANSRSALYFAIQLASETECSLTFFHCYNLMTPTSWNGKVLESFEKSQTHKIEMKLKRLVESIYKISSLKRGVYKCVISRSLSPEKNIIDYAEKNEYDFICMSRRGSAVHKNIFGTITSRLISKSLIPVIAVPPNYRREKITKVLYASDLTNLEKEVKLVIDFIKPLNAKLELLHFKVPSDVYLDRNIIEKASKKFFGYPVNIHLRDFNFSESLVKNLDRVINSSRPSITIMFTHQHRDFFDRLFLPGVTPSYAFKARVPLLIFPKARHN